MSYFPGQRSRGLPRLIILSEVGALILGLAAIEFADPSLVLWLIGIITFLLHTILFYRLGRKSERARAQSSSVDFFRGFKRGLPGQPDEATAPGAARCRARLPAPPPRRRRVSRRRRPPTAPNRI
jgi:hypothetical protein